MGAMTTVDIAPLTPEWFAARRQGIGASEIAAVLGLSPWESPLSLYWRKVNGWQVEASEAMSTGTILEPAIAEWAAAKLRAEENATIAGGPEEPIELMANRDRPWQLATPDRLVYYRNICPSPDACICSDDPGAVLECKWTGSWDGWGEPGTDEIPVHYRCQVLWQCDVVGVDYWYVAVLGPSGFRLYSGRRDDKDIAVMVEAGRRFMARIEAGDPPPLDDHHATVATLKRLHPDLVDETATVDDDIAAGYLRAVRMARLAERLKSRYEAELRDQMGDARRAKCTTGHVATRVVTDVAESTVTRAAHRRDYLLPPRERNHAA